MRPLLLTAALLLLAAPALDAQGVSGSQFLDLSENSRLAYVVGFMDAKSVLLARPGMPESLPSDSAMFTCVSEWTYVQTRAVVDLYLTNHPERWHERISILMEDALYEACAVTSR